MQHLDEGTIHSWLDGALTADEAARVEAHVKDCPQCAAAVAEARGFVAAASRILTSLDNVPSGVVPAVPRTKTRNWAVWRAAAAVLVVALGSFVVLRDRTGSSQERTETANTVTREDAQTATEVEAAPPQAAPDAQVRNAAPIRALGARAAAPPAAREMLDANTAAAPGGRAEKLAGAAPGGGVAKLAAPVPLSPSAQTSGVAAMDAASASQPLRVVAIPRVLGEKRTIYEVAPGDTVVLSEVSQLADVVTTGATSAAVVGTSLSVRSRQPAVAKASVPADTQRKTEPAPLAPASSAAAQSAQTSNGTTTISWIDPRTGSTMRLSGRHTQAELVEIRRRIEQARAAEAAKKKP